MEDVTQETGNQTVESQEVERDADTEALFESFGLPRQQAEKKDIQFPKMDEPTDEPLTMEEEDEEIQQPENPAEQKRTIKVKFLGEDKDVPEDEAPTWIQKGMNHDRLQERLVEQQKALDEVAQLQGYKDHADLIANLPKLREQQQQKQQNEFEQLRNQLIQDYEDAGGDPRNLEAWLDSNPLLNQAKEVLRRDQERAEQDRQVQMKRDWENKWNALYQAFPDLTQSAQVFNEGGTPDWYTPEMQSRIQKGYDPIDAYKLAHSDKISAQSKKATEQKIIRQQQLGARGQINSNTATPPDEASLLPAQIALAEEFGVSLQGVQRQQQLLKNRR